MPIGVNQYQILSPEQANPIGYGMKQGADTRQSIANALYQQAKAEEQQAKNPYVGQQSLADLINQQNINKMYIPKAESEINLQGASAGNQRASARKTNYEVDNPGYMGNDESKFIQFALNNGMITPEQLKAGFGGGSQPAPQPSAPQPQPAGQIAQSVLDYIKPQQGGMTPAPWAQTAGQMSSPIPQQQPQQPSPVAQGIANTSMNGGSPAPANSAAPFHTGNPMVDAMLNKPFAASAYQSKMTAAFDWVHSSVDQKNYEIAQLAGAGIDPSVATRELSSGKTVPQVLEEKGFDPQSPPDPDFLPTRGNIQQLKQRQSALEEVKSLGEFVREGLGPYAQTINHISPKQVEDAITGQNEDQQVKFLAAMGLAPELSGVRLQLAQAKVGKGTMDSMINKSMTNIDAYQSLVTPKVWMAAQKEMDKQLTGAFEKASKVYSVGNKKSAPEAESSAMATIIDPDGGEHEVLASNVAEAIKRYPGTKVKE